MFLDDDILVAAGWAKPMTEPIEQETADATVCRITLPPASDVEGLSPDALRMLMSDSIDPESPFLACSFAVRRAAFDEAGGFDVELGIGSNIPGHEDLLLTLQLRRANRKILFVDTVVEHLIGREKFEPAYLLRRRLAGAQSDGWMAYHWFGHEIARPAVKARVAATGARLARLHPKTRGYAGPEGRLAASAAYHRQFAAETSRSRKFGG